jgi:hypothetical protein
VRCRCSNRRSPTRRIAADDKLRLIASMDWRSASICSTLERIDLRLRPADAGSTKARSKLPLDARQAGARRKGLCGL